MADHHVGHFFRVGVLCQYITDKLALAQNGNTVGNVLHLVQFMRDNDDRLSVGTHIAQHGKELVRFLRGEHSSGLIENQYFGVAVQHLDDLHRLLLRDRHIVDLLVRVHIKAVAIADCKDFFRGSLHVKRLIQAEHDVFRSREHVDQLKMLVHHTDPESKRILRRADNNFLPVHFNGSLIRKVNAGKHVHQCRFPASVFSENGKNLSAVDIEPYLVIGQYLGAEALGDISHFYNRDVRVQFNSSLRICAGVSLLPGICLR